MNTSEWMAFDRGLRWLSAPPSIGCIAVVLGTGIVFHTHAHFSIVKGELQDEGWGGDLGSVRRIARLLAEAGRRLEESAASFSLTFPESEPE